MLPRALGRNRARRAREFAPRDARERAQAEALLTDCRGGSGEADTVALDGQCAPRSQALRCRAALAGAIAEEWRAERDHSTARDHARDPPRLTGWTGAGGRADIVAESRLTPNDLVCYRTDEPRALPPSAAAWQRWSPGRRNATAPTLRSRSIPQSPRRRRRSKPAGRGGARTSFALAGLGLTTRSFGSLVIARQCAGAADGGAADAFASTTNTISWHAGPKTRKPAAAGPHARDAADAERLSLPRGLIARLGWRGDACIRQRCG